MEAAAMSWSRQFDEPIPLPDGGELRYIEALPKAKHQRPEWQTATEMLLMAAEGRGPMIFAHIAMLKALNAWNPKPASEPRKKVTKKYKVIR
jgi:hypothetical protein